MIRRAALALLVALLVLVGVVVVRTRRLVMPPQPASSATLIAVNDSMAAARLAQAVRFQTVSYTGAPPNAHELLALHEYLRTAFPRVHAALQREVIDAYSLLYRWSGTDSTLPPLVLMGHLDVVPVERGTEQRWTHAPFSGDLADGFVWGRGTLDDKVSVLGELEAVEALLAAGFQPTRTVYLAFGHDEEVFGQGAQSIVDTLRARGVQPFLVLDEGLAITRGIIPGLSRPAALIGVAEKGTGA